MEPDQGSFGEAYDSDAVMLDFFRSNNNHINNSKDNNNFNKNKNKATTDIELEQHSFGEFYDSDAELDDFLDYHASREENAVNKSSSQNYTITLHARETHDGFVLSCTEMAGEEVFSCKLLRQPTCDDLHVTLARRVQVNSDQLQLAFPDGQLFAWPSGQPPADDVSVATVIRANLLCRRPPSMFGAVWLAFGVNCQDSDSVFLRHPRATKVEAMQDAQEVMLEHREEYATRIADGDIQGSDDEQDSSDDEDTRPEAYIIRDGYREYVGCLTEQGFTALCAADGNIQGDVFDFVKQLLELKAKMGRSRFTVALAMKRILRSSSSSITGSVLAFAFLPGWN
ncbi:unnamed protein product [Polarella glacialis]|uniref:Uncharacterized protein n=1 Tax=Polarella glacialis TaxID=89957 RepID=A0A813IL82_POLGL|nr:unnamed protein product [Polarella glacialis]